MSVSTITKTRSYLIPALVITFGLAACGGGGDSSLSNTTSNGSRSCNTVSNAEPNSEYQGSYSGQFSGTKTGTWQVTVTPKGLILGSATTTSLPETSFPLEGVIETSGVSNLVTATAGIDITFMIVIVDGQITGNWTDNLGGGALTAVKDQSTNITGSFDVSVELRNFSFTPLSVTDWTETSAMLAVSNNKNPDPAFYDALGVNVIVNPDNSIAAIIFGYFNTGALTEITQDYLYLRNCTLNPCPSAKLDLLNKTLSFNNTELPVDSSSNRPGITNIASLAATINGSICW